MAPHCHPLRLHSSFPDRTSRIRKNLLQWYATNARVLPWRTPSPSPYAILVSEIMCQQTQIKTVIPYFERWMAAFHTFKDLAKADVDEVMRLWSGLGYYSRGRKLLEAARWIEENGVPKDVSGWKKVPGCGDYTAGAVSRLLTDEFC
jgi:A/G-specific adenine glycosylase